MFSANGVDIFFDVKEICTQEYLGIALIRSDRNIGITLALNLKEVKALLCELEGCMNKMKPYVG